MSRHTAISLLPLTVFTLSLLHCLPSTVSFTPSFVPSNTRRRQQHTIRNSMDDSNSNSNEESSSTTTSIDVSDLNLTTADLSKPIPTELLSGDFQILASGSQSTSLTPSSSDDGCLWEESSSLIGATLSIPTLRGQPTAAAAVVFSTTTCTVTVFGMVVWSCVLRGECQPESALVKVEDGYDSTPLITVSVEKKEEEGGGGWKSWGGLIDSVGENSIV